MAAFDDKITKIARKTCRKLEGALAKQDIQCPRAVQRALSDAFWAGLRVGRETIGARLVNSPGRASDGQDVVVNKAPPLIDWENTPPLSLVIDSPPLGPVVDSNPPAQRTRTAHVECVIDAATLHDMTCNPPLHRLQEALKAASQPGRGDYGSIGFCALRLCAPSLMVEAKLRLPTPDPTIGSLLSMAARSLVAALEQNGLVDSCVIASRVIWQSPPSAV